MPMPSFSFFSPMPGLPWYLVPIWPLIYVHIRRLQAWFYANCGPESEMHWAVTRYGRVDLIRLSDDMCAIPNHPWVPIPLSPSFSAALDGQPQAPSHPCSRRMPEPQAVASEQTASAPGIRRLYGHLGPIPDT